MNKSLKWAGVSVAALLALQGCGTTVGSDAYDSGSAGTVAFPDIQSAWLKEGTFPNLDSLRLIDAGITKDQLYRLVGRPHFSEGLYGVREWNYIFNFRTGKGAEYVTCQYRVIFDKNLVGRSFFWAPATCADRLKLPPAATERVVERVVEHNVDRSVVDKPAPPKDARVIRIAGDLLFAFNRSGATDLLPGGTRELDRFAKEYLDAAGQERVEVLGHTDRLGSESYNQRLSEARAETVRRYLMSRGLAASRLSAAGRGMQSPLAECHQSEHMALVECLSPDRRVELVITTTGEHP